MRFLIAALLLPAMVMAQEVDSDVFLASYRLSEVVNSEPSSIRLPWIDRYELRTETRDFDLAEQEYTLRLSPASGRLRRAQLRYHDIIQRRPDYDSQEALCDYNEALYKDWVELYILETRRKLIDTLIAITQDEYTVYQRLLATGSFDAQKFITRIIDLSDYQIMQSEDQAIATIILQGYGLQDQTLNFDNLITPIEIKQRLDSLSSPSLTPTIDIAKAEYDRLKVEKEIAIEVAEARQYIDFAQLRYQGPTSDQWRERLSIGIGVQLDRSGNRTLKTEELQKELLDINLDIDRVRRATAEKQADEQDDLNTLVDSYMRFMEICNQEETSIATVLAAATNDSSTSPLLLLAARSASIRRRLQGLSRLEDILGQYVQVLVERGLLCDSEAPNYLKS